jgi:hypothetical protein
MFTPDKSPEQRDNQLVSLKAQLHQAEANLKAATHPFAIQAFSELRDMLVKRITTIEKTFSSIPS